jgi:hypothetical protein
MSTVSGFPLLPPQGGDPRAVATAVNLAMRGKVNASTVLTLTPNATVTALVDDRIGPESFIGLAPLSSTAAAALATTFVAERHRGSATFAHANSVATDRSFCVLIIG